MHVEFSFAHILRLDTLQHTVCWNIILELHFRTSFWGFCIEWCNNTH